MKILRETKQRKAIHDAMNKANRPLNPKEILEAASSDVPNLGIATVYRNIKTMVERGEIVAVEGVGIAPCYDIDAAENYELWQVGSSLYKTKPEGFREKQFVTVHIG